MMRRASTVATAQRLCVAASALASCLVAGAARGAPDGDALDRLMAQLKQRQHAHATFTERHISSVLDHPLE